MDSPLPVSAQDLLSLPQSFYPLFDVCHILLCVVAVRKEAGKAFAHAHPAAALLSCVVSSFAGSLLANPLMGEKTRVCLLRRFCRDATERERDLTDRCAVYRPSE